MSESKSGLNTPFDQSTRYERKRLHLGVCGSVACYKAADLLRAWAGMGIHVSATLTPARADLWPPCSLSRWRCPGVRRHVFAGAGCFFAP